MKRRCIAVVLLWVIITCFGLHIRSIAYADPFTASQIGSLGYAMMQSWGISFNAGNATAAGMNDFMTSQVEDYVNSQGGSIADLFIGDMAVDVAGKLVVSHQLYNSMVDFTNWLIQKYDLGDIDFELSQGEWNNEILPKSSVIGGNIGGVHLVLDNYDDEGEYPGYHYCGVYNGDSLLASFSGSQSVYTGNFEVVYENKIVVCYVEYIRIRTGAILTNRVNVASLPDGLDNTLSWNGTDYLQPTVLNPDKAWTGTIGGYSEPDTNLDQLLDDINQAVADNNLVVDGEVIDVPVPPGPVPTWTPVDDVIDGINQQGEILEGIGNDIGDISGHLDDIGEQVDGIEQSLEGVQEGIETQTDVISGAIEQANQDVVDAIGEQTATLDQTLTETAEGVQDIVDALQPGEITPRQFDLRGLFPFCIPFDIHNLLQKFQATPVAPHVQLPFVIQSIGFSYTFDLDFSAFDSVAAIMRTVEYIVFAIGLAWATSKVIKW